MLPHKFVRPGGEGRYSRTSGSMGHGNPGKKTSQEIEEVLKIDFSKIKPTTHVRNKTDRCVQGVQGGSNLLCMSEIRQRARSRGQGGPAELETPRRGQPLPRVWSARPMHKKEHQQRARCLSLRARVCGNVLLVGPPRTRVPGCDQRDRVLCWSRPHGDQPPCESEPVMQSRCEKNRCLRTLSGRYELSALPITRPATRQSTTPEATLDTRRRTARQPNKLRRWSARPCTFGAPGALFVANVARQAMRSRNAAIATA